MLPSNFNKSEKRQKKTEFRIQETQDEWRMENVEYCLFSFDLFLMHLGVFVRGIRRIFKMRVHIVAIKVKFRYFDRLYGPAV